MLKALCSDSFLFAVSTAKVVVLVPLLLMWLGEEQYGLWALVIAATGYLNLANFGISGGVVRRLAEVEGARRAGEADEGDVRRALAAGSLLFAAQALALALLSLLLAAGAAWVAARAGAAYPEDAPGAALLVLLVAARLVAGALVQLWPSVLYARHRLEELYAAQSLGVVVTFLLTLVAIELDLGLAGVAVANLVGFLPEALACRLLARRALAGVSWRHGDATRREMGAMFGVGGWLLLVSFAGLVQSRTLPLLIGALGGLPQVALYDANQRPWRLGVMMLRKLPNILWPGLSERLGAGDARGTRRRLRAMVLPSVVLGGAGIGAAWPLSASLMGLWVGEALWGGWLMAGAFAASAMMGVVHHGAHLSLLAAGRTRAPALASLAEVVVGLGLLVALVPRWGAAGGVLAGTIAHATTLFWFALWYVCRVFDVRPWGALRRAMPLLLVSAAPALVVGWMVAGAVDAGGGWAALVGGGVAAVAAGLAPGSALLAREFRPPSRPTP